MRVVISGTYGSGKSTLAQALSTSTGLPLVAARGMREFLRDHFNNKPLDACTFDDLIELGPRRFPERHIAEASHPSGYLPDGSTLNEWAYGLGRIEYGFSLRANEPRALREDQQRFTLVMDRLGKVFHEHASSAYDLIVHLPPELPIAPDQHRPLMPAYRAFTDTRLRKAYSEIGLSVFECTGPLDARIASVQQRIGHVIAHGRT